MRHISIIALLLCWSGLRAAEAPQADADAFHKQVEPILSERCYECHGAKKQKGRLRLDSVEAIKKGGKNGPVVKPGNPEKSPLYERVSLKPDDDDIMPAKGDPLTPAQIKIIGDWIKSGADFGKAAAQPAAK